MWKKRERERVEGLSRAPSFFLPFFFPHKSTKPGHTNREKLPCDPLHAKQATSCFFSNQKKIRGGFFGFFLCFVALAAHSEGLLYFPFVSFRVLFLFLVGFGVIRFGRYTLQQVSCYTTPERIPTFMATALLSLAGNILFGIWHEPTPWPEKCAFGSSRVASTAYQWWPTWSRTDGLTLFWSRSVFFVVHSFLPCPKKNSNK